MIRLASAAGSSATSSAARPYIGGQAVLEGVMMRSPKAFAVVVRCRDGSLHVRERAMHAAKPGIARLPLVRGILSLVESLRLGSEALRFSADQMERDISAVGGVGTTLALALFAMVTRPDGTSPAPPERGQDDECTSPPEPGPRPTSPASRTATWLTLAIAIGFVVALPQAIAAGTNRFLGLGWGVQSVAFQAMTGVVKLSVVVGYLLAIRQVPEIRRVFQYHGAEHKTISTYEAGEELTVAIARPKTTMHARCGTTFLVMVAMVSIAVFAAIGAALPRIHTGSALLDNLVFFLEKLPFLPAIAAITFEIQRLLSRYCAAGPLRVLLWPGFLVQKITTAEPTDDQLEVALASLRMTLFRQEGRDGADAEVVFPSYQALLDADGLPAPRAA
jgi:uncharacterized protein YqhQ